MKSISSQNIQSQSVFKLLTPAFLFVILVGCQSESSPPPSEALPPTVGVAQIASQELELKNTLAGRVTAVRSAEIRPQVSGIIIERMFEEGSRVEAGDQLYQIDPATYEATLANTKGELAVADANAHTAQLRVDRYRQLNKTNALSQQDLDEAEASWLQAKARVQVATAAVQTAQINLDYTAIRAPISGTVSRSNVTEGALVSAQQANALAVIRQLSPTYVDIKSPAADFIARRTKGVIANPQVTLELEDGSKYQEIGQLQFSESFVDAGTGSVTSRVLFDNKEKILLPGMFVRATIINETLKNALLIPQQAVLRSSDGKVRTYLVVDDTATLRELKVGQAMGDQWLVLEGLADGDRVIVSGLQKIRDGAPVRVEEPANSSEL